MYGGNPYGRLAYGNAKQPLRIYITCEATLTVDFRYRINVGTREFITPAADTPANTPFRGALDQPVSFDRSIINGSTIGNFVQGSGSLTINNASGYYDFLPQQYALDGRPVEVRYGRMSDKFAKWLVVFKGTASDFEVSEDTVTVSLVDNA